MESNIGRIRQIESSPSVSGQQVARWQPTFITMTYPFSTILLPAPFRNASLSIVRKYGDAGKEFGTSDSRGSSVGAALVVGRHLPDEIEVAALNIVCRDLAHIGKWITERRDDLPCLSIGPRGRCAVIIFVRRLRSLPLANPAAAHRAVPVIGAVGNQLAQIGLTCVGRNFQDAAVSLEEAGTFGFALGAGIEHVGGKPHAPRGIVADVRGKLEQVIPFGGSKRRRGRRGDASYSLQQIQMLREPPVGVGKIQQRRRDSFAVEFLGPVTHLGEN